MRREEKEQPIVGLGSVGEKDLSATFPLVSFGPFHMSEEPAANVCHKDAHEEFVFTYGTLKRGFHNHEVLGSEPA